MKSVTAIHFLLGATHAVTAGLKNTNWPRYEVTSYTGALPAAATVNGYTSTSTGLYRCVRDGFVAVMPQMITPAAASPFTPDPVFDATVRSFYGTDPTHNGVINRDFGCCSKISLDTDCPALVWKNVSTQTFINNRTWIVWNRTDGSIGTDYGTSPGQG